VIDGEEAKKLGRWNVVASLVEDMPVLGGWSVRPTARWRYLVGGDAAIAFHRGHHLFGPKDKDTESVFLAENRLPLLYPMLLAISAWSEGTAVVKRQLLSRERRLTLRPGFVSPRSAAGERIWPADGVGLGPLRRLQGGIRDRGSDA
jgi:hypothetical protein